MFIVSALMPQQENTMNDLLVIKAEYYFGKNIWPAFASVGTAALTCSVLLENAIFSSNGSYINY